MVGDDRFSTMEYDKKSGLEFYLNGACWLRKLPLVPRGNVEFNSLFALSGII